MAAGGARMMLSNSRGRIAMKQIAILLVTAFLLVTGAAVLTVAEATIFSPPALANGCGGSNC